MIEDWDSYALIDFIPVEPDVYMRLFERLHQQVWPSHIVAVVLMLILPWLWHFRSRRSALALLAGAWVWVGYFFFIKLLSELNQFAGVLGYLFFLQAAVLLLSGWVVPPKQAQLTRPAIGLGKLSSRMPVFAAVTAYLINVIVPVISLAGSRAKEALELFAITPDATALVSLALVLSIRHWSAVLLAILPTGWCALSGAIWWALEWKWGLVVPGLAGMLWVTWGVLVLHQRHRAAV